MRKSVNHAARLFILDIRNSQPVISRMADIRQHNDCQLTAIVANSDKQQTRKEAKRKENGAASGY
jgi:hypothetical protein